MTPEASKMAIEVARATHATPARWQTVQTGIVGAVVLAGCMLIFYGPAHAGWPIAAALGVLGGWKVIDGIWSVTRKKGVP